LHWFVGMSGLIFTDLNHNPQRACPRVRATNPIIAALAVALSIPLPAPAFEGEDNPFIYEQDSVTSSRVEEGKPWKEQRVELPPWPKDSDLIEFKLDGEPSPFRYFIDGKHLAVGADGVVRYTLVVESSSGARNVSFEGVRCTARGEYKVYAYGAAGKFNPVDQGWQPASDEGDNNDRCHRALSRFLLCVPRKFAPRPKKDMIRALEGHVTSYTNAEFLSH
jgi:hypothetical protein